MKSILILLLSIINCFYSFGQTQNWRSELYPANWQPPVNANFYSDKIIQDFSFAGYHRGEKPIPDIKNGIIDISKAPYLADNSGKQDVTLIIQKALDDAGRNANGGVVFLPKGIYKVSPVAGKNYCLLINRSRVILRGAGPGQTFIYNTEITMRNKMIISVDGGGNWNSSGGNKQLITHNLLKPTVIIPVQNTTGFKTGDLIIVRNYINNDWIAKHNMLEYWKDKGPDLTGLLYFREIKSINTKTNEITIDIPIRYALETAHGAAIYKAPTTATEIGIENLAIGNKQSFKPGDWTEESYHSDANPSYQSHDSWAFSLAQVYNCWVRNVSSYSPEGNTSKAHLLSNGLKVSQTKNVSLVNCAFKSPQFGGGGGNGYMFRIMGNETLIQDCVAEFNRHGFVMADMTASGNVFLRCLDKDTGKQTGLIGNEKTSGSGSDHHMHFSHSNLFDQCTVENSYFAAGWRKWGGNPNHGLTGAHSVYWNLTSNGTQAVAVQTQQGRYGYVIGTSGNKPEVDLKAWHPGTEISTDPLDYVEGKGKGKMLQPQSLYLDQVKKKTVNKSGKK